MQRLSTNLVANKTVLIVDGGGRGATLVDKYGQSKYVKKILVVPGNDLMQINTKKPVKTFSDLKTTSVSEILGICLKEKVDLVDVAQDNAVEVGLVDELQKHGVSVVGPTKASGQIEWDKAWACQLMVKYKIPHPQFQAFTSKKDATSFLKKQKDQAWFVKASGLAEGKGALPASNNQEAMLMVNKMERFGTAGATFLLEEWLEGEEFSAFALCDGNSFKVVGYAQDHKRVNDGDQGPNTGGMGCVSNPLIINANIKDQISKIFQKTIDGLKKEDRPYLGVLYLGGMVVKGKVYVIEFNARWGDPEAEVILPSIKTDYIDIVEAATMKQLNNLTIEFDNKIRVSVAGCSKGYPEDYSAVKGKEIFGLLRAMKLPGIIVYGAGIRREGKRFQAFGGRIFHLVSEGRDIIDARKKAYEAMSLIAIEGDNLHYRTDIGWRDVQRISKLHNIPIGGGRKLQNPTALFFLKR